MARRGREDLDVGIARTGAAGRVVRPRHARLRRRHLAALPVGLPAERVTSKAERVGVLGLAEQALVAWDASAECRRAAADLAATASSTSRSRAASPTRWVVCC